MAHVLLSVFTKSRFSNYYYREFQGRDEVYLPFHTIQSQDGWSLTMSPCNSLISVVYRLNLRVYTPSTYQLRSVFFVKIRANDIARCNPVLNAQVRDLTFSPTGMLLVLRHGAVFVRPRIRSA